MMKIIAYLGGTDFVKGDSFCKVRWMFYKIYHSMFRGTDFVGRTPFVTYHGYVTKYVPLDRFCRGTLFVKTICVYIYIYL